MGIQVKFGAMRCWLAGGGDCGEIGILRHSNSLTHCHRIKYAAFVVLTTLTMSFSVKAAEA
jgi:hypothetical protein